jgi:hypothetical protein
VSDAFDDLARLAADLDRAGARVGKQARGIVAKAVDAGAADARQQAEAKWTKSGRESGDSAESIRARMSKSVGSRGGTNQLGYIMVDGGGVFQETGAAHHPPNPVLPSALDKAADLVEQRLGDVSVL